MSASSVKPSLTGHPCFQVESATPSFASPALFCPLLPKCQLHMHLAPPRDVNSEGDRVGEDSRLLEMGQGGKSHNGTWQKEEWGKGKCGPEAVAALTEDECRACIC